MPRVLFLVNLLEDGVYSCHTRVSFASARQLQAFFLQNPDRQSHRERDGWRIAIHRGPSRGYDGKPLYQADIRLYTEVPVPPSSPPLTAAELQNGTVLDSGPDHAYGERQAVARHPALTIRREPLTWQERAALQHASKALLVSLGVTDLGRWR